MGCRTEPAAVHIAHVLQRLHFFQFVNFFYNLHDLRQKKITRLYRKKEFKFFIVHTTYRKKKYTHLPQKNYTTRRFFCTRLTFFIGYNRAYRALQAQQKRTGQAKARWGVAWQGRAEGGGGRGWGRGKRSILRGPLKHPRLLFAS